MADFKHVGEGAFGLSDAAGDRDTLGIAPVVRGCAGFLTHPDTEAAAFAIYGRWGQGKSTFMRLLQQEMLQSAATAESPRDAAKVKATLQDASADKASRERALAQLRQLAKPRLICSWFNAWQYLGEQEIWAGLVVELVKGIEQALPLSQRWALAMKYNLRARTSQVVLRLLLPVLLATLVVGGLTAFGAIQLTNCLGSCNRSALCIVGLASSNLTALAATNSSAAVTPLGMQLVPSSGNATATSINYSTSNGVVTAVALPVPAANLTAVSATLKPSKPEQGSCTKPVLMPVLTALVVVVGGLLVILVAWNRFNAVIKPMSEAMEDKLKYISLPDHNEKVGYQNEVIRDIGHVKAILQQQNTWFAACSLCCDFACCLASACQCLLCWCCSSSCSLPIRQPPVCSPYPKLVVFIDDLDRVPPLKVVDVLEAVNVILTASQVTTVLGADKAIIKAALKAYYKDNKHLQGSALFLEKIIQVSLTLSVPHPDDMQRYITELGVVGSTSQLHAPPEHRYGWLAKQHAAAQLGLQRLKQRLLGVQPPRSASGETAAGQQKLARYTVEEVNAIHQMLQPWVLQDMTPRQVKSLLNHHFLLRCIYQQVVMQQHMQTAEQQLLDGLQHPGSLEPEVLLPRCVSSGQVQEMKMLLEDLLQKRNQRHAAHNTYAFQALISWTFFWGRYPLAMAAMLKYIDANVPIAELQLPNEQAKTRQSEKAADGQSQQEAAAAAAADASKGEKSAQAAAVAAGMAETIVEAGETKTTAITESTELQANTAASTAASEAGLDAEAKAAADNTGPDIAAASSSHMDSGTASSSNTMLGIRPGRLADGSTWQPRGIHREGNQCYGISVLQALMAIPSWRQLLQQLQQLQHQQGSVANLLVSLAAEYMQQDAGDSITPITPWTLPELLDRLEIGTGNQEDAQDFLGKLLNDLFHEMPEGSDCRSSFANLFSGAVLRSRRDHILEVTQTQELRPCRQPLFQHHAKHLAEMNDQCEQCDVLFMHLPVGDTLQQSFDFWSGEAVSPWESNPSTDIKQSQQLASPLPEVLIIHLLAFVQDKTTGAPIKVRPRALNTQLDVSKWCSLGFGASSSSKYQLVSTVVHIGQSIKAGHYVAYMKLPDERNGEWWWRCNDHIVTALEEEPALAPTEDGETAVPYLLFYVRKAAN